MQMRSRSRKPNARGGGKIRFIRKSKSCATEGRKKRGQQAITPVPEIPELLQAYGGFNTNTGRKYVNRATGFGRLGIRSSKIKHKPTKEIVQHKQRLQDGRDRHGAGRENGGGGQDSSGKENR
jgi:hypothetical protein